MTHRMSAEDIEFRRAFEACETTPDAFNHAAHVRLPECSSASSFLAANPTLLDSKIMLTHYSAELLFSSGARKSFVPPDLQTIPPRDCI